MIKWIKPGDSLPDPEKRVLVKFANETYIARHTVSESKISPKPYWLNMWQFDDGSFTKQVEAWSQLPK